MSFKSPNIKGPRFRKEYRDILNIDLYKKFVKLNPKYSSITVDQFKTIIKTHSGKMWETAANSRDGVELPIGGSVFVGSTKITKKNNYNIKASIAANKPIKHRNYETDGFVAKIYYSPYLSKIGGRDRSIWSFKGGRSFTRTVAREYPKKWNTYIVVADICKIVRDYHKYKYKNFREESTRRATLKYNEFDI